MVVESGVQRTGYADFWELRGRGVLPAETTNYVPIILAMTIMEKNAAEYGLEGVQLDAPLEYDTVQMTAKTSMALVSDITDTSLPELAGLNPSVLKSMVPADYPIHVPKGTGTQLMAALEAIPAEHRDSWRMHRLGIGETVSDVGKRFGIAVTALVAANNLKSHEPSEGDRLIIPAVFRPDPVPVRRSAKGTVTTAAHRPGVSNSKAKPKASAAQTSSKPKAKPPAKAPVVASAKPRVSN